MQQKASREGHATAIEEHAESSLDEMMMLIMRDAAMQRPAAEKESSLVCSGGRC